MDPKSLKWVIEALGEASPGGSVESVITGVCIDSRDVREGDLFVALEGERQDGHAYVAEAFRRGAAAALISRDIRDLGGFRDRTVIRVPDTRLALVKLARQYRKGLAAEIIAVTGSNGKTTVKDLIAHLLAGEGKVVAARKSFNNDIGLPLTLLSMDSETRFGVLEMGTNQPGEIAALCRIAHPDCGVVTNVGSAHLEGLGGLPGVAEEKGALVEALPASGMAFLNNDDYYCQEMSRRADCAVVRYGFDPSADLWGLKRSRRGAGISFFLYGKMKLHLPVPGFHNAANALAAVGVALRYGVSPLDIQDRLASARLPEMRMNRRRVNRVTLINDAYNANPGSVNAAIGELTAIRARGRKIFVLGDMCELGNESERFHRQVGKVAAAAGFDRIWAVGRYSEHVARGAEAVNGWGGTFHASATTRSALDSPPFRVVAGDTILVKGSRRMRMERVHDRFLREAKDLPPEAASSAPVAADVAGAVDPAWVEPVAGEKAIS